jgi:membrane associated rhomboid family serine protease
MWLHAGLIHLASNMYGLYQAGFPGEKAHGWWKILFIYMISGVMGNVISSIFLPTNITVGASGAVFGLFGAMWGDFIQNCGLYKGARCAQLISLLFMTVINLGFGAVVPMIDNFAHLGGFLAGLLASLMLFARPRLKRHGDTKGSQKCIASVAGVLLFVYVTAPVVMLFLVEDLRSTGALRAASAAWQGGAQRRCACHLVTVCVDKG